MEWVLAVLAFAIGLGWLAFWLFVLRPKDKQNRENVTHQQQMLDLMRATRVTKEQAFKVHVLVNRLRYPKSPELWDMSPSREENETDG